MKRYLFIGIIVWNVGLLYASTQDSIKVERWLKEASCLPQDSCRTLFFAKQMLGIPYVAGTLDENKEERLVIHLDKVDCTTFVETILALALAEREDRCSWDGFKEALKKIRYRDGVVDGYSSRLHYFSDWIQDNEKKGVVMECTDNSSCRQFMKLWLDYMSTHACNYLPMKKNPALIEEIAFFEKNWQGTIVSYIPKDKLNLSPEELKIKNGDILAMVTNIKGLDVVHVGFAFWKGNQLHLLHASSSAKCVIEDSRSQYESSKNKIAHLGVRAIRFISKR